MQSPSLIKVGKLPNMRRLITPKPGYILVDMDLSRADAQVVAWESGDHALKEKFKEEQRDPSKDVHSANAISLFGVLNYQNRQYAKIFCHGCVTAGHEVLTPLGWRDIATVPNNLPIIVWEPDTKRYKFEIPESYYRGTARNETLHTFVGQSYDLTVTQHHTFPVTNNKTGVTSGVPAHCVTNSDRLAMTGYYEGTQTIDPVVAKLVAAYQADGCKDAYGHVTFNFHRERKILRMRELLKGLEHTDNGTGRFYVPSRIASMFTAWGKCADESLLTWDGAALDTFLEELQYWDGSSTGTVRMHLTSVDKRHVDWLQTYARLRGYGSQVDRARGGDGVRQTLYRMSLNNRQLARVSSMQVSTKDVFSEQVYCPKTSTGYWLVRRNGKIMITGNTNYGALPKTLARQCNISVSQAENMQIKWFSVHPDIKRWHDRVEHQLHTTRCISNAFGYRIFFFDRPDTCFNEALAWTPQSTVGHVINLALCNIAEEKNLRQVEILLQNHDSLVMQIPNGSVSELLPQIRAASQIVIPYQDPLIIPVGFKLSKTSWGDCHEARPNGSYWEVEESKDRWVVYQ